MRRRELMAVLGGAALGYPPAAWAQPKAMPMIGTLSGRSPGDTVREFAAFRRGLSETGYDVGRNLAIEYRWAEGRYDRFPAMATDLAGRKVDLIAALGGGTAARAAKAATSTIPIVFFIGDDPVADGLVGSLARPGGNLTGVSLELGELTPKRLELLGELVPRAKVIGLLVNPNNANSQAVIRGGQEAARTKELHLDVLRAGNQGEIDAAFASLAALHPDALVIGDDPFFTQQRGQLVALAARQAVPAIYPSGEFARAGGLISYAPSFADALRRVGNYAGRILKGAKPADLPVQQPTKFELVVNLKTAKALGLTVPQSILARADEVIE
jgi:putative ABC transport system substrate-binding protein